MWRTWTQICTRVQILWRINSYTQKIRIREWSQNSYFSLLFCVFFTSPSTVPSTHHQNCTKMAYNLPSKMMLYFMKCTHFSYRYSYMHILYHHEFSNDLIHSLIPWYLFDHPFSKCGHLNDTHCGIKIYVNGWYLKSYIHIWNLECQSFHMMCL
jgi:mannosyltransferase OCH1-like enzyme